MLRPEHALFERPFPLDLRIEETPTPDNFRRWDPNVGDTVPTFAVFERGGEGKVEPGLVTGDHGFEDVPDAERILGGINMKGPGYAAIARHGSFVMWGFHCLPGELTPTGRRLYLNTLAYATAHAGAPVETLRLRPVRTDLLDFLEVFASFYPEERRAAVLARHYAGDDVPAELLSSPELARAWYDARAPYLHPASDGARYESALELEVDPDCAQLGLPNDALTFLDALVERLAADPSDALAGRLVARYVPDVAPAELGQWLAENRDRLYFTEAGGWVWRVRGTSATPVDLRPTGPPAEDELVRARAEVAGSTLKITLRVASGWHAYSPASKEGREGLAMHLRILEGSAFAQDGEAEWDVEDDGSIEGFAEVRVPLRRIAAGDALALEISYVACDAQSCRPRRAVTLRR